MGYDVPAAYDSDQLAIGDNRDPPKLVLDQATAQRRNRLASLYGNHFLRHKVLDPKTGFIAPLGILVNPDRKAQYVFLREDADYPILTVHNRQTGKTVLNELSYRLKDWRAFFRGDNIRLHDLCNTDHSLSLSNHGQYRAPADQTSLLKQPSLPIYREKNPSTREKSCSETRL
jgi:hypothetical protein